MIAFFEELNDPFPFSCYGIVTKFNLGKHGHQSHLPELISIFEPNGQTSMFLSKYFHFFSDFHQLLNIIFVGKEILGYRSGQKLTIYKKIQIDSITQVDTNTDIDLVSEDERTLTRLLLSCNCE